MSASIITISEGGCIQNNANTSNNTGAAPGTTVYNDTANNQSANANGGVVTGVGAPPPTTTDPTTDPTNSQANDGDLMAIPLIAIISGLIALF